MPKPIWGLLWLLLVAAPAFGQQPPPGDNAGPAQAVRVYVDCQTRCDMDYFRTELAFVEYMRDRQDAQVHVLVTSQSTGAGGSEYTLSFTGRQQFDGLVEELRFTARPNSAQDEIRRRMGQMLTAGLVRYLARAPGNEQLAVTIGSGAAAPTGGSPAPGAPDPWRNWVFRAAVGGFSNGESAYSNYNVNASFSANRVTPGWKTNVSMNLRRSRSSTDVGDRTVTNLQSDQSLNSLVVRSISNHWSAGWRTNLNQSSFLNQDLSMRGAPAIEYNIFPYSESTRRQLTMQYSIGLNQVDYEQETIYGRFSEQLLDQRLNIGTEMRQRWGNVRTNVEASHYLHDPSKHQLGVFGNIELRIFRGVGLNFNGNFARIRDQLHLPKGGLTPEQILIRQQQIATSYRYFMNFNLSYSFGSIYNTVVNPRMGN